MAHQILLIGKDRTRSGRISTLLESSNPQTYQVEVKRSALAIERAVRESEPSLALVHYEKPEKTLAVIQKVREKFSDLPITAIVQAVHPLPIELIELDVHHVLHPDHLDALTLSQMALASILQMRIKTKLQSREEILKSVNYAAQVFLSQLDWMERIQEVLGFMGVASKADRVCIYENADVDDAGVSVRQHACWNSHSKAGFGDESKKKSHIIPHSWVQTLRSDEPVTGDLRENAEARSQSVITEGAASFAAVPVFADSIWWGMISFEYHDMRKEWSQIEIEAIQTAAKIIGAAIARLDAETRLTHLATHDYLTNLPNRMLLEDRYDQAVARAERGSKKFGIITIDLDKFKTVNDTHGHPFGDKVLVEVAWRLSEAIRSSDTCARVGGDEFTVLAEGINNKKDLIRVMEKLSESLSEDIQLEEQRVKIKASMGASIYPNHGITLEDLLKSADVALYQVKASYSGYKVFIEEPLRDPEI